MSHVGAAGKAVGLSFNWSKLEVRPVKTCARILKEDGDFVPVKDSMVYLGSSLASNGRIGPELNRRIGLAHADFRNLQRIWSNSSLTMTRKTNIFGACIVSKALHGLEVACLNVSDKRRLDGFQARCLRRICKIPPAFVSRVSNATVRAVARQRPLSEELQRQRLLYLGELVRRPGTDPVRRSILEPGTLQPRSLPDTRRIGRPRQSCIKSTLEEARRITGADAKLCTFAEKPWTETLNRYFSHGRLEGQA